MNLRMYRIVQKSLEISQHRNFTTLSIIVNADCHNPCSVTPSSKFEAKWYDRFQADINILQSSIAMGNVLLFKTQEEL